MVITDVRITNEMTTLEKNKEVLKGAIRSLEQSLLAHMEKEDSVEMEEKVLPNGIDYIFRVRIKG